MRIVSQDGRIDLPYENFSLSITQDNSIVAARDVVARPMEMLIGVVAKYSNFDNAKRALEELREKYVETVTGCSEYAYTLFDYPKVFQFPTDKEIDER
ncbi:MAG: hypothetical protein NC094_12005 [Bacteroidales bacterium]|nr:hypothetical protein [Lachnoclostridium sp.]MCM1385281.1 hypothetical protein [Lachnoclostridium sp.]MCM1466133.1 hypothetical protein [Bacteroidales bacterium]